MKTLRQFATGQASIPPSTAWYLSDLGEFRGKQELYMRQSPQRLKALREHAMIESAVSSNRIEGVSIDPCRVRDILMAPKPLFRDRDEEEVRGYRDALAWIHAEAASITADEQTIKRLHVITRGQIWDAGQYKELEKSSQRWHEGKHDPWPYINYVLFILKTAYKEFAERIGETKAPRGAKTDQVLAAIHQFTGDFSVAQLELRCPGVSRDMVRRVLRERQAAGEIECQGRGPAAKWRKKR